MNTTPGTQTTEFRFSAAVVAVITVLYGAFMALTSAGALHVSQSIVAAATAIYPVVTGGVVVNYSYGRAQLKIALANATTQQTLASIQAGAPLLDQVVTNANTAAQQGVTQTQATQPVPVVTTSVQAPPLAPVPPA